MSLLRQNFCVWFTQWEMLDCDVHQYEMTEESGVHLVGHQRSVRCLGRTFMGRGWGWSNFTW